MLPGVEAINSLLGRDAVTESMLYERHMQLHQPEQLFHKLGASLTVLLSVLAEHGLSMRHPHSFIQDLGCEDTHLLLNNGWHWTVMVRVTSAR